jgi:predicted small secreted protein
MSECNYTDTRLTFSAIKHLLANFKIIVIMATKQKSLDMNMKLEIICHSQQTAKKWNIRGVWINFFDTVYNTEEHIRNMVYTTPWKTNIVPFIVSKYWRHLFCDLCLWVCNNTMKRELCYQCNIIGKLWWLVWNHFMMVLETNLHFMLWFSMYVTLTNSQLQWFLSL